MLACPWLAELTHLTLDSNKITRAGALPLREADNLDGIVSLDLCDNKPGRAASAACAALRRPRRAEAAVGGLRRDRHRPGPF